MSKLKTIGEGRTYNYIIPAFIVLFFGAILGILTHPSVVLLSLAVGATLIFVSSGIQINVETQQIRKYASLLGFKVGAWQSLKNVRKVDLVYFKDGVGVIGNYGGAANGVEARSYDLIIYNKSGEGENYHSFIQLKPAFRVLKVLEKNFNFPVENGLLKMQQEMGKTRRR